MGGSLKFYFVLQDPASSTCETAVKDKSQKRWDEVSGSENVVSRRAKISDTVLLSYRK